MIQFELARVTDVSHVRDHRLWLRFSDGLAGEVDLVYEWRAAHLAELGENWTRVRQGLEPHPISPLD